MDTTMTSTHHDDGTNAAMGSKKLAAAKAVQCDGHWLTPGDPASKTQFQGIKAEAIKAGTYEGKPLDEGGRFNMMMDEAKVVHGMSDEAALKSVKAAMATNGQQPSTHPAVKAHEEAYH